MSGYNFETRSRKNNVRQRNQKIIRNLIIIGAVLVLLLVVLFLFNLKGKKKMEPEEVPPITQEDSNDSEKDYITGNIPLNEDLDGEIDTDPVVENEVEEMPESDVTEEDVSEVDTDIDIEKINSEDENVLEAFTEDWSPIGTNQTSPHVTVYSDDSPDRIEIKRAVSAVIGIEEADMIEWWVGNAGDHQTAVSNISNLSQTEFYRAYLTWVDDAGWKVTKYERIKEYSKPE